MAAIAIFPAAPVRSAGISRGSSLMLDLLLPGIGIVFFLLAAAYAHACDRL